MSKRRRRSQEGGPMPAASAGLLRFFREETHGIKVKPELVISFGVILIVLCIIAQLYLAQRLPFM